MNNSQQLQQLEALLGRETSNLSAHQARLEQAKQEMRELDVRIKEEDKLQMKAMQSKVRMLSGCVVRQ